MAKKKLKTVFVSVDGTEHDTLAHAEHYDEEYKKKTIRYNICDKIRKFYKPYENQIFTHHTITNGSVQLHEITSAFADGRYDALIKQLPKFKKDAIAEYKKEYES